MGSNEFHLTLIKIYFVSLTIKNEKKFHLEKKNKKQKTKNTNPRLIE